MRKLLFFALLTTTMLMAQELTFTIALEKNEYLVGEDFMMMMHLKNNTNDTLILATPDVGVFHMDRFNVFCLDVNGKRQNALTWSSNLPQALLHLPPHEEHIATSEFSSEFQKDREAPPSLWPWSRSIPFPPGDYRLKIDFVAEFYSGRKNIKNVTFTSNELNFKILPITSEMERLIFDSLQAYNKFGAPELAFPTADEAKYIRALCKFADTDSSFSYGPNIYHAIIELAHDHKLYSKEVINYKERNESEKLKAAEILICRYPNSYYSIDLYWKLLQQKNLLLENENIKKTVMKNDLLKTGKKAFIQNYLLPVRGGTE